MVTTDSNNMYVTCVIHEKPLFTDYKTIFVANLLKL